MFRKIKNILRNIKYWFQRRARGWSDDITWDLNNHFIEELNIKLKKYRELAGKVVNLEFHTFEYQGKTYTQLELIDKLIDTTDELIKLDINTWDSDSAVLVQKDINEVFNIMKLIVYSLWW